VVGRALAFQYPRVSTPVGCARAYQYPPRQFPAPPPALAQRASQCPTVATRPAVDAPRRPGPRPASVRLPRRRGSGSSSDDAPSRATAAPPRATRQERRLPTARHAFDPCPLLRRWGSDSGHSSQSHADCRLRARLRPTPHRGERDLLRDRPAAAGERPRFSLGATPGSGGGLAPHLCVCVWALWAGQVLRCWATGPPSGVRGSRDLITCRSVP
jgi:hypothetical protein